MIGTTHTRTHLVYHTPRTHTLHARTPGSHIHIYTHARTTPLCHPAAQVLPHHALPRTQSMNTCLYTATTLAGSRLHCTTHTPSTHLHTHAHTHGTRACTPHTPPRMPHLRTTTATPTRACHTRRAFLSPHTLPHHTACCRFYTSLLHIHSATHTHTWNVVHTHTHYTRNGTINITHTHTHTYADVLPTLTHTDNQY